MLHARRAAMAEASCAATLAAIGITSANAAPRRMTQGEIDRELRLWVSDGFCRQTWNEQGHVWSEVRDKLVMREDEIVRISILNDTPSVCVISFGDRRPLLRIRAGEAAAIDLFVDSNEPFEISVVGQPPLSRPVKVRSNENAQA